MNTWDAQTADRYLAHLLEGFQKISDERLVARSFSDVYPNLRVCLVRHHFVFFLFREERPVQIIALIHERRDVVAVLVDRI